MGALIAILIFGVGWWLLRQPVFDGLLGHLVNILILVAVVIVIAHFW